jgi:hypothetical protein
MPSTDKAPREIMAQTTSDDGEGVAFKQLTDLEVCNAKPREKAYRLFGDRGLYLDRPSKFWLICIPLPATARSSSQERVPICGR